MDNCSLKSCPTEAIKRGTGSGVLDKLATGAAKQRGDHEK